MKKLLTIIKEICYLALMIICLTYLALIIFSWCDTVKCNDITNKNYQNFSKLNIFVD